MRKAIIDATGYANKAENRKEIADAIAPANYLNQPPVVVEQALTGSYADGLGQRSPRARRAPASTRSRGTASAIWILTQMKRWGQLKGDVDYAEVAAQIYLATDAARFMRELGLTPPASSSKTFVVMGKMFDPAKPDDYLASFPDQAHMMPGQPPSRRHRAVGR